MTERGTLLGQRYELDQIIGRGGMAEVWRARDTRLGRDVAIKRLRIDLASDPTFQERFRREAQSAAGLNHPNIVAVYDTGEELDTKSDVSVPYIVMELVEGVTLREVLRDGRRIVPQRALEFTTGVLEALAYSHRAGIIHRDIKPANVMLTPGGTVKVMDFGIARAVADTSATMTQTAAVIGTAQYLSPEQARGERVDNRSDIYAVGCLLYELLVGQPPFKGDSPVSVAYQHVRETPVAPSRLDPEVTSDMDAITLKALEKDPADRYQDARDMRADILRALGGHPVQAALPTATAATALLPHEQPTAPHAAVPPITPTPSPDELEANEEEPRSRKGLVALAVLGAVLLVGLIAGVWMLLNPPPPEVAMSDVPRVTGMTEAAARNSILNEGLEPVVQYEAGTNQDVGQVLRQNPEGGLSVPEGSNVTIWVSQGPDQLTIPANLVGMTEEEALAALDAAGFDLANVDVRDADPADEPVDAEAGTVVDSEPAANAEVSPDREVVLLVATGRSLVPELKGLDEQELREAVERAGFSLENLEVDEVNASGGENLVTSQTPEAATPLDRTGTITVTITRPLTETEVPTLRGLTEDEARQAVADAGFTAELDVRTEETNEQPPNLVFDQDPAPGVVHGLGDPIRVTIAIPEAAPEQLRVPNLTGMTEERANEEIGTAGFTSPLQVTYVETNDETAGEVFEQEPAPGEMLEPGDPIQVSIAVPLPEESPTAEG